ncbi:MAG: hypothetical protein HOY78_16855 [Saccharothrix sp.]|nr:hypothetical protein [Saccharothrix sp.]
MRAVHVLSLSVLVGVALSGPHTHAARPLPTPAPVDALPPATPTTTVPALADPTRPAPADVPVEAVAEPAGRPAGTEPVDGESVAERNNRIATPRPPLLTHVPPTPNPPPTIYNGGPTTVPPIIVDVPTTQPTQDPDPTATTQPPTG